MYPTEARGDFLCMVMQLVWFVLPRRVLGRVKGASAGYSRIDMHYYDKPDPSASRAFNSQIGEVFYLKKIVRLDLPVRRRAELSFGCTHTFSTEHTEGHV